LESGRNPQEQAEPRLRLSLLEVELNAYFLLTKSNDEYIRTARVRDQIPCLNMCLLDALHFMDNGRSFTSLWKEANLNGNPPKMPKKRLKETLDPEQLETSSKARVEWQQKAPEKFNWSSVLQKMPPDQKRPCDWSALAPREENHQNAQHRYRVKRVSSGKKKPSDPTTLF